MEGMTKTNHLLHNMHNSRCHFTWYHYHIFFFSCLFIRGHRRRVSRWAPHALHTLCASPSGLHRSPAGLRPHSAHRGRHGPLEVICGPGVAFVDPWLQVTPEKEVKWGQIQRVRGPGQHLSAEDYLRTESVPQPFSRHNGRVRRGTILLEPLLVQQLPVSTHPPVQRSPDLTRTCRQRWALTVTDSPALFSNQKGPFMPFHAHAAHCTLGCALHTVQRSFRDQIGCLRRPESKILGVHPAIQMKMGLVAEPDLVKELSALLAMSKKLAAVKKPRVIVDLRQCLVNGDLIREQLYVVSG